MNVNPSKRRWMAVRSIGLAVVVCTFSRLPAKAPLAQANTILVTNKLDTSGEPNTGTLRDAIIAANTKATAGGWPAGTPGMETIRFNYNLILCSQVACAINLTSRLPVVTEDLTIIGVGVNAPQIGAGGAFPILDLHPVTVNISSPGVVNRNAISEGAAIFMQGGTLMLNGVRFPDNSADTAGGAVCQEDGRSSHSHATARAQYGP